MTLYGRFDDMLDAALGQPPSPLDQGELRAADFFCGIGGFHVAARNAGVDVVFACDIDDDVRRAYTHNYLLQPEGDITGLDISEIPDHDLMFAGFPCQPFSIIGRREGFADPRGNLFFDLLKVIRAKRPQGIILENVKQLSTTDEGRVLQRIRDDLEGLGYATDWRVLNALDYGLPQKRERTMIVATQYQFVTFPWPQGGVPMRPLSSVLETNPNHKHFVSQDIRDKRQRAHTATGSPMIWHENKGKNVSSHPWSCALRAGASHNYLLVDGERRLTPRECLRLQGFPEDWEIVCSDAQTRKQAGNAVPVPMVQAVIEGMVKVVEQSKASRTRAVA